jgi:hypothetical protein
MLAITGLRVDWGLGRHPANRVLLDHPHPLPTRSLLMQFPMAAAVVATPRVAEGAEGLCRTVRVGDLHTNRRC